MTTRRDARASSGLPLGPGAVLFMALCCALPLLIAGGVLAGLMREDGSIPRLNRILFADAGATVVGSLAGLVIYTIAQLLF